MSSSLWVGFQIKVVRFPMIGVLKARWIQDIQSSITVAPSRPEPGLQRLTGSASGTRSWQVCTPLGTLRS